MDPKERLHDYLRVQRADLLGKLDGLDEYAVRRPLTATGTNLLGLVKHVASVQLDYFGEVFGRPHDLDLPWLAPDAEPDADLWVPVEETREDVLALHRLSATHSDATIEALPLDAQGSVPWWPADRRAVTLHQVLVHMVTETARHAGHADILREQLDASAGRRADDPSLTARTAEDWATHRDRIEVAAREAASRAARGH